ncbi:TATA box-binding protein-associated factor RNA polymerase I subunit B [Linum grandiflorum]
MKNLEEEEATINNICQGCSGETFTEDGGYYYCQQCGSQALGFRVANVAVDDLHNLYNVQLSRRRRSITTTTKEPNPCSLACYQFMQDEEEEEVEVTTPSDRQLTYDDYSNEVRFRYVIGLQTLIQSQCDALIHKLGLSPLIPGLASSIWLRYVVVSGVFKDGWADDAFLKSESEKNKLVPESEDDDDDNSTSSKHRKKNRYHNEPLTAHGLRAVSVWLQSLKKSIPMDYTLAICYLACHIAKEAVLPTDFIKWSIEGILPYFTAHSEIIDNKLGAPSMACPKSSASMFKPTHPIPLHKLEGMAATIAESIGLSLPPINFYGIACRYLNQLSIPSEKILPLACRIYEWSMPPDLWLSKSEVPSRICAMSILIVAIRILYNLNGFGAWERSLSKKMNEFDSDEVLLRRLEAGYNVVGESWEFGKDLTSYLQYCKDVVFEKGSTRSSRLQDEFVDKLWDYYQYNNNNNSENAKDHDAGGNKLEGVVVGGDYNNKYSAGSSSRNEEELSAGMMRKLKLDMKEKEFCYLPPRVNIKKTKGYLHYRRRKDKSTKCFRYVAHADYYILLRSCAKVAQVDCRMMHLGVLAFERRLDSLEKRIRHSLHLS